MPVPLFHKQSISRNLAFSLLLVLGLVACVTLVVGSWLASSNSRHELHGKADEYIAALADSLALPLWNLDAPVATMIGKAYMNNEAVAGIRIVRADTGQQYVLGQPEKNSGISRQADILYHAEHVGSVTITLTEDAYTLINRRYFRWYAITLLLMTLALSFMSGVVLRRQLQRPFTRFIDMVDAYAAGDEQAFTRPLPFHEFSSLITVLKQMQRTLSAQILALRDSEERFRFVLNNSLDAAYRRNLQTDRYDYMSPVIEQVLGWTVKEMDSMDTQTVLNLIHPDDVAGIVQEIERTNALCQTTDRATGRLEYRIRHKDGEYRWVGDIITVLTDEKGRPLYRLGMVRDITVRKQAEKQMTNQNTLLEKAVQQKEREMEELFERLMRQEKLATIGQIAGSIAHELRNPLGAIKNAVYYLNLLAKRQQFLAANPKVREYLDLIDAELNSSERVIADLLQMTRMKPPQRERTDVEALLNDVLIRCHMPEQIDVTIEFESAPFQIWADPLQLRQVLVNVLCNAGESIEGKGTITISAKQLTECGESCIVISDSGPGIEPDKLTHIFEPLYTTKATGTGLGLAICKQIIENHQGRISIASEPGRGTTVTIVLPQND